MRVGDMTDEDREIYRRVDVAFDAWKKAQTRVGRCKRPDALEAARVAEREAEIAYRKIVEERDAHVEIRRAQETQRGGRQ